jgi:acyl carrier protein
MVQQGARHLVLVGRRGASEEATRTLNILRETGAAIVVMQADVAQEAQVAEVLSTIGRTMPPLRGIFHAAMQIEDGVLLQMDRERFSAAVKPKAHGAWNLHALTAEMPLDFFVLFSSAASLFGSVGQGNYVAGNAFLDALAHYRRGLGLPALTINWGQWAETHLTTRPGLTERLALLGMNPLPPERGFEALAWLLRRDCTQVAVMSVQWQKIFASFPAGMRPPMLAEVAPAFSTEATTKIETEHVVPLDREAFLLLPANERQPWMVSHVQNLVAHVLRLSPSEVSVEQPLNLIGGLDSLMAIEIKNRLETGLGIELPLVRLLEGPTIVEFAEIILQELSAVPAEDGDEKFAEVLERVKNLSDEEVQAMLEQERRNG